MLTQTVIAFEVGHSVKMLSGSKILFDTIKTNIGGGWSHSTHTFTAPVDGLYYLSLGIMTDWSSSPGYARARIMRGSEQLRYIYTHKGSRTGYLSASGSVVIPLNRGQKVHAERYDGTLYSDRGLYTHFVGFLIQKLK